MIGTGEVLRRLETLEALAFVPGETVCDKCGFVLTSVVLTPGGAFCGEKVGRCPNGHGLMRPRTEREAREAMEQRAHEFLDRAIKAEGHLNTPELHDFAGGVVSEAQHQRARWGAEHDAGKTDADWFWLVGHLASKALMALRYGDPEKALHHIITTSAALANWHAALTGASNTMRPGIDPAKAEGAE